MKHNLHEGVTRRIHPQPHVEAKFTSGARPVRKDSFIFGLYGFWPVQACEMDRRDGWQIGRPSLELHVGDVEAGFAYDERSDG